MRASEIRSRNFMLGSLDRDEPRDAPMTLFGDRLASCANRNCSSRWRWCVAGLVVASPSRSGSGPSVTPELSRARREL
jgi:hypothetical protein